MRQGCVLSARLFCAVLEMAMGMWRRTVGRLGFDLGDGGPTLLDRRFADDILIFATTHIDAGLLLDEFVLYLALVRLVLNTEPSTSVLHSATLAKMGRDDLEQLFVSKPNGSFMVEKTSKSSRPRFCNVPG